MRTGVTISTIAHAAFLLWAVVTITAIPYTADLPKPILMDVSTDTSNSQITAGVRNAPKTETPRPLAEKLAERRPPEDPTAKVVDKKEITAATDAPPPLPEPKPPTPKAEKKQAEPKRDLIAEALKKDEAKRPEPKKLEAKTPTPPKRPAQEQPKFDPKRVEALLDKRTPQRLAATGDAINDTVSLGAPSGLAAQLSQSELDALRARRCRGRP